MRSIECQLGGRCGAVANCFAGTRPWRLAFQLSSGCISVLRSCKIPALCSMPAPECVHSKVYVHTVLGEGRACVARQLVHAVTLSSAGLDEATSRIHWLFIRSEKLQIPGDVHCAVRHMPMSS